MIAGETFRIQHLLRRTAFGCRPGDLQDWFALGEEGALKKLVDYDHIAQTIQPLPVDTQGNLVAANDVDSLKRYWLLRFCETSRPLEETMTLFWHGHFATSDYKVQNPTLEWRQNEEFRKYAMGSFRDLLGLVAVDPAMLIWLDGNNSKKGAPNENFSRELLELFSMGVDGGYTERDVKEGAKAYTGWSYNDDRSEVSFHVHDYNAGTKYYLGQAGNFDLEQGLNIVARHPSTARFISKKLFEFFVHEDPPAEELDRLSAIYFKTKYSIRELVRGVLSSPHFYSDRALYAQVKSPVQYAVSMTKALNLPYRWVGDMQGFTDNMGQQLLNPPNVKGWKQGRNWINTNTMTSRLNFATHAVDQLRYRGLVKGHLESALAAHGSDPELTFTNPAAAVDAVWNWLLPSAVIPELTRNNLIAYMTAGAPKDARKNFYLDRAHGLIELVLSSPEYQLA